MNKEVLQNAYDAYLIQQKKETRQYILMAVMGLLVFFLIWQAVVTFKIIPTKNIAAPTDIIKTFFYKLSHRDPDGNTLPENIVASLQVSLTGYLLAVIVGVPLGLLMGWYEGFERFVKPIFELIRPIPPIAWIPLIILWIGIGLKAKIFIIFFSSFIPCVINSYTGIKLTSQTLINVSKTFGASKHTTFFRVGVPSAMPMVLTGMRIALGSSWSTLVAAEMLAASAGLGYMILMGRSFSRPDIIMTGMLVIGILGAGMSGILQTIEKRLLRWRISR